MSNLEDHLNESAALNPKPEKKSKLSLRAILREVLSAGDKKVAKKVIEFLISMLLTNRKIENPQIAKLFMEHIDGKPTITLMELAAPTDLFDGLTPEEMLVAAGLHLVDPETGKVRPKELVKKKRKSKKKKKTRRAGRRAKKKKEGE